MGENNEGKKNKQNEHMQHGGMGSRGVARPMAEMETKKTSGNQSDQDKKEKKGKEEMGMDRMKMLHMHHEQTLWVYWAIILLGVWMVSSPFTFSYNVGTVEPSGGRELWLSLSERINYMKWSDILSGLLLIILGWRSLTPNRPVSIWICCFIGIWISMAPLIFWSPNAVGYYNSTIVGALIIALTILIPGMPNMINYMKMGGDVPPGWSYNPSSWPQRGIMIALAFIGWIASRYLGAFQMGYVGYAWDPFFGDGTLNVLNSKMSHSLPISDAALGTFAYTLEFLMGWMGGTSRWRTMPWMVTFFGILVIPLGFVSIFLVISQPLTVGAWCALCLFTAIVMLPMIPLQVDEVIAMGQHMVQRKQKGDSLWKVFWKGGDPITNKNDERSPELLELPQHPGKVFKASVWGMGFPWNLALVTVLGIWLMFSPAVFGVGIKASAADLNHLGGALVVVIAVVVMAEPLRIGRYLNILIGLAIAMLPWFIKDGNLALTISSTLTGLAVVGLSFPKGAIYQQYGLWGKYVK
ncbi:vitamin K epoxide reductase family protein [Gillisia sp. Hel_I_86]|uniref:vitamin K epoxide reductase family protein n=1 Tax=Gillisia sp. Hel_I_86 TaxID=1249981 RepID=UPI00119A2D98|nr:vitamin K epoxide reductase family protein [Gillisia sp. Hel_I_86]TVZ26862.1 vitamin K epoxide reductase family protein [Gillisia sp. Hel_I_86]